MIAIRRWKEDAATLSLSIQTHFALLDTLGLRGEMPSYETPTHPLEQAGIEPPTCMRQVDYAATPVKPRSVVVVMCGTVFTGLVRTSAAICEVLMSPSVCCDISVPTARVCEILDWRTREKEGVARVVL